MRHKILLVLALGLLSTLAYASPSAERNPTYTRLKEADFPFVQVGSSTGAAQFTHGVLAEVAIRNGASAVYNHFTWTTSIAQPSFPTALTFWIRDDTTTNNSYTCSEVIINGLNSLGDSVEEKLSKHYGATPLTETATTSKFAYIRVDKIRITGCKSGNASSAFETGDVIRVWQSGRYVGFPTPIAKHGSSSTNTILISACRYKAAETEISHQCFDARDLYRFKLDPLHSTIDLLSGLGGAGTTHDNTALAGTASDEIMEGAVISTWPAWRIKFRYLAPR